MITDELYNDYQSRIYKGDRKGCSDIVIKLLEEGITMKDLYINLFQRSLYNVGKRWERNEISVAIEHLVTSITESLIALAYPYLFSSENNGRKAIVLSTPGEYHQVGAKMVADYFEINSWDAYYLGTQTPEKELFDLITKKEPDIVAISMSISFNANVLKQLLLAINERFPNQKIIIGGQGFNWEVQENFKQITNCQIINSLYELDRDIFNINENGTNHCTH